MSAVPNYIRRVVVHKGDVAAAILSTPTRGCERLGGGGGSVQEGAWFLCPPLGGGKAPTVQEPPPTATTGNPQTTGEADSFDAPLRGAPAQMVGA